MSDSKNKSCWDKFEEIEKNWENQPITFTPFELKVFVQEITDMIDAGEKADIRKAIHNALYFGEIEKRSQEIKAGHWIEHDLIEVEDDD